MEVPAHGNRSFRIHPSITIACCLLALALAGCATPRIDTSAHRGRVATIEQADTFIRDSAARVDRKASELVDMGQVARAATFVGTLGLGASGLAELHKDAAIGFATLAAIGLQGLPVAAPPIWIATCEEAKGALHCLGRVSGSLTARFASLRTSLIRKGGLSVELDELREKLRLRKHSKSPESSNSSEKAENQMRTLKNSAFKAEIVLSREPEIASALHGDAVNVLDKLNELLLKSQPPVAAFQLAAAAIVNQAAAASSAPAPSGKSQEDTGVPKPAKKPPKSSLERTEVDPVDLDLAARFDSLTTRASSLVAEMDSLVSRIGEGAVEAASVEACKARLVGATAALRVEPAIPETGLELGKDVGMSFLVSGGTGTFHGMWLGESPPSDLMSFSSNPGLGGTQLTFRQLKDGGDAPRPFKYLIMDTAATPARKEITVTVPKK